MNPGDAAVRAQLTALLDSGLKTDWRHRADTSEKVDEVTRRLQQISHDDYAGKLKVAGVTVHPYVPPAQPEIEQACSTCVRYERVRRYCNLPELELPVEPEWSCVVWRL